jgi:hypothetical protein
LYLLSVTHLPEDGHMRGRNMQEILSRLSYIFKNVCTFVGFSYHIKKQRHFAEIRTKVYSDIMTEKDPIRDFKMHLQKLGFWTGPTWFG